MHKLHNNLIYNNDNYQIDIKINIYKFMYCNKLIL